MPGRWNPSAHPRYPNGKFRPKLSHGARLSPNSVSYSAGVRVPIVPGRANLYVGALARVERAGSNQFFKRQTDNAVNTVAGRFGDSGGRSKLAQVLKGNEINSRGLRVQGPKNLLSNPTFRVSSTPASRATNTVRVRPRRDRVRRPDRSRTPSLTSTVRTSAPAPKVGPAGRRAIGGRKPRKRRARARAAR